MTLYLALLPSLLLLENMFVKRNHYMPSERRLIQTIQLCTVAVCCTLIMLSVKR